MSKRGKTSKSPKAKENMRREAEQQKVYKKDITEYMSSMKQLVMKDKK